VRVGRLEEIPGFGIDRVAARAGDDPDVLRLENLDTDLAPPPEAVDATREAAGRDDANSYLPFTGRLALKQAVAERVERRSGARYEAATEVVITGGDGDGLLDALLALTDPDDEVILTDPVYAGMLNRVRLAGAVPRLVPLEARDGWWRLDVDALTAAASPRTRAVFLMNPSFPSGCVLGADEWEAVAAVCCERGAWLIYWSLMEGIVFDGRPVTHPASLPGMRDRTITIGSVSMEQRMIGWRLGWIVAPEAVAPDLGLVHIYNSITPGGIAQAAALAALTADDDGLDGCVAEWERRRDAVVEELDGLPVVPAAGGWSLLLDTDALGIDAEEASDRLLEQKVAATPMTGWGGDVAARHVRLVFSNEPVQRLRLLGGRVRAALEAVPA
jgi:aspartate/methionine/tyrosine aminotransferase